MIPILSPWLNSRARFRKITRLAVSYARTIKEVEPLFDELGEFGAMLTLHIAAMTGLCLLDSKRLTIEGAVALGKIVRDLGVSAEDASRGLWKVVEWNV
jgi:hypothetical protein